MEDPTTPNNETTFTPNETQLNCAIMQNLTSEIQVSESAKAQTRPPIERTPTQKKAPYHPITRPQTSEPHHITPHPSNLPTSLPIKPTPSTHQLTQKPPKKFDTEKVALSLGYKSATSLRARWNTLKRSKIAGAGASASASPAGGGGVEKTKTKTTPGKKATPKKKATFAKVSGDEDGEETAKKTGSGGKGKKGKKGGGSVKVEEKSEEESHALESIEGVGGVAVAVVGAVAVKGESKED